MTFEPQGNDPVGTMLDRTRSYSRQELGSIFAAAPTNFCVRAIADVSSSVWFLFSLLVLFAAGCSSRPNHEVAKDPQLIRYVGDGRDAFDEGDLDGAEKKYRRALLRAWAIDDPYESGTVAYNLAACLTAQGQYDAAANWLVDARVDLCRGKASAGNTWLLSAEIAMARQRYEDADRFVGYAAMTCPPCEVEKSTCLCGPSSQCDDKACRDCCIAKLPCIGDSIKDKKASRECREAYRARIELARARLAAQQFDLITAKQHLANACGLAGEVCDLSLRADTHDVAALIHDAEGEFLQAGAHRDREIRLLRCIGQYREIPTVLDAAADSYCQAERKDLAMDRLVRSARIRLARGHLDEAWQRVRWAGDIALMDAETHWLAECQQVEIRMGLTAMLIEQALDNHPDACTGRESLEGEPEAAEQGPDHGDVDPSPDPPDLPDHVEQRESILSPSTEDRMELPPPVSEDSLRSLLDPSGNTVSG